MSAPARHALPRLAVLVALVALCLTGCGKSHNRFKHPRFMSEADCAACLEIALEAEIPDARREAVVHVAKTDHLANDVVIRALATLARTDRSNSVRYAAVRALAKAGVPAATEPIVEIATAPDDFPEATNPRAGAVRWAALEALDPLLEDGALSDAQRAACRAAALRLLSRHRSRDVRIAAAALLRHFPDGAVLETLIDALDQRDFGVVYQSERSLVHLTGRSFAHNPAAWRHWLATTDAPFADAGRLHRQLYPEEENWWERTVNGTRRAFAGFRPQ